MPDDRLHTVICDRFGVDVRPPRRGEITLGQGRGPSMPSSSSATAFSSIGSSSVTG